MGYSITIGELKIEKEPEDGLDCSCIGFSAKGERHDNAPAFGEPTDFSNSRWPSYSVWSDNLKSAGLYDLFFDEGHLIGGHPGIRLITAEFIAEFDKRKKAFEGKHPDVIATYGEVKNCFEVDESNPSCNSTYCRVVWLDYWLKWAFDNCETPVINNT